MSISRIDFFVVIFYCDWCHLIGSLTNLVTTRVIKCVCVCPNVVLSVINMFSDTGHGRACGTQTDEGTKLVNVIEET